MRWHGSLIRILLPIISKLETQRKHIRISVSLHKINTTKRYDLDPRCKTIEVLFAIRILKFDLIEDIFITCVDFGDSTIFFFKKQSHNTAPNVSYFEQFASIVVGSNAETDPLVEDGDDRENVIT